MSQENPSITFFLCTIGRRCAKTMLQSILKQYGKGIDKVEMFFDGPNFQEVGPEYFQEEIEAFGEDLVIHVLPENLGCWGHSIRNAYQKTFTTDYVWNIDDDDYIPDGVVPRIREDLKANFGKMLMYKFRNSDGIRWRNPIIEHGNVGTPSGLIPNRPEVFGHWGEWAGGDAHFYATTEGNIGRSNIIWIDFVTYKIRPEVWGW